MTQGCSPWIDITSLPTQKPGEGQSSAGSSLSFFPFCAGSQECGQKLHRWRPRESRLLWGAGYLQPWEGSEILLKIWLSWGGFHLIHLSLVCRDQDFRILRYAFSITYVPPTLYVLWVVWWHLLLQQTPSQKGYLLAQKESHNTQTINLPSVTSVWV